MQYAICNVLHIAYCISRLWTVDLVACGCGLCLVHVVACGLGLVACGQGQAVVRKPQGRRERSELRVRSRTLNKAVSTWPAGG
jgi:hypothetical protein